MLFIDNIKYESLIYNKLYQFNQFIFLNITFLNVDIYIILKLS